MYLDRKSFLIYYDSPSQTVRVRGLVSKFSVGGGRSGTDRQFFYVNGRPCTPTKAGIVLLASLSRILTVNRFTGAEGFQRNLQNIQC